MKPARLSRPACWLRAMLLCVRGCYPELLGLLEQMVYACRPAKAMGRLFDGEGPRQDGAALLREVLQTYECQRNCCGFLAEPCESTMLTSAGPRWFIASSRAPRMCFGSSTKKPLPPKASITRS